MLRSVPLPCITARWKRCVRAVTAELVDMGIWLIKFYLTVAKVQHADDLVPKASIVFCFRHSDEKSNGSVSKRLHAFPYDRMIRKFLEGVEILFPLLKMCSLRNKNPAAEAENSLEASRTTSESWLGRSCKT